jgi:ferredoxin-thioredoxin reductase catalytic subunit
MANPWDSIVGTDEYNAVLRRAQSFVEQFGFNLNPDEERVRKVVGLMTMNHSAAGDYYCPCKQTHPLDTENDVICPCPELDQELEKDGNCFCRLFYR